MLSLMIVIFSCYKINESDYIYNIGDFFSIWSAPVLARQIGIHYVYDLKIFFEKQHELGLSLETMQEHEFGPFPYPPNFMMMIWGLGFLPLKMAYYIWSIIGFLLLMFVVSKFVGVLGVGVLANWIVPGAVPFVAENDWSGSPK